jgi:hypothetical protein
VIIALKVERLECHMRTDGTAGFSCFKGKSERRNYCQPPLCRLTVFQILFSASETLVVFWFDFLLLWQNIRENERKGFFWLTVSVCSRLGPCFWACGKAVLAGRSWWQSCSTLARKPKEQNIFTARLFPFPLLFHLGPLPVEWYWALTPLVNPLWNPSQTHRSVLY